MKKKINLLFILNSLHFGGAEKHVISLLNGLSYKKFNQFLGCLKDKNAFLPQIKNDRVKDIFCLNVSWKFDLRSILQLARYIDKHNIDIVVCTNQYPMLYGVLAEKFAKKSAQVIVVLHTTLILRVKERLQMLFYRSIFKRCSCVVFVSKNQERYWLEEKHLKVQKTIAIQNGIDISYFEYKMKIDQHLQLLQQLNFSQADYIVGFCAALRHEKYHIDAIDAVAKLRNAGLNVKLLFIGDGPERENIEHHILRRKLVDEVVITGFQEDVRPYITICSCMVITSHSETFSIAALEAMAMGKPLIMTNVGGASEQIFHGQNGFLYKAGEIEALAGYLIELSDEKLRKQIGEAGKETVVKMFSLPRMIEKYETLFSKIV